MNSFSGFSYFEVSTPYGYLSAYPSGPNKCVYTKPIPTGKVLDLSHPDVYKHLSSFLNSLKENNFGFSDFFFFAKAPNAYSATELIEFYRSLEFGQGVMENDICKIQIKSSVDSSFSKTCYLKDTSLPQEALDTFVFFADNTPNKVLEFKGKKYDSSLSVVLGTKRRSDSITVSFVADSITLLKTGIFGTVILGEHLENHEKAEMNSAYTSYLECIKSGKNYYKLPQRSVKAALRNVAEELGFTSEFTFDAYLVGKDTLDGRDPRYWTFGSSNEFGYKRKSESVMVALVARCAAPSELPDPQDRIECDKGIIVPMQYALGEFSTTGQLKCAFASHPRQLKYCYSKISDLF
jgi:hypothetical protein